MTIDEARQQLSPNDWHRSTASSQGDWLLALFCDSRIDRGSANSGRVGPPLRHHKRGCPTLRAFRRVGTTDLNKEPASSKAGNDEAESEMGVKGPAAAPTDGNWKLETRT